MVLSAGAGRLRTRFDYWVRDVTGVLREYTETFWMWSASRDDIVAELAQHGSPRCPTRAIPRR